jgi:hypothetical protein
MTTIRLKSARFASKNQAAYPIATMCRFFGKLAPNEGKWRISQRLPRIPHRLEGRANFLFRINADGSKSVEEPQPPKFSIPFRHLRIVFMQNQYLLPEIFTDIGCIEN